MAKPQLKPRCGRASQASNVRIGLSQLALKMGFHRGAKTKLVVRLGQDHYFYRG
jgi:hypothetical protein